jgi:hypothetical protein
LLKTSIYIQIVIRWASIHRLSICIIDLPTTAVFVLLQLVTSRFKPHAANSHVSKRAPVRPLHVDSDILFFRGSPSSYRVVILVPAPTPGHNPTLICHAAGQPQSNRVVLMLFV